jgi:hypothetical protein
LRFCNAVPGFLKLNSLGVDADYISILQRGNMRWFPIIWLCIILPMSAGFEKAEAGWETYRSDKFGYEFSYPTGMKFTAYFDGSSGDLTDTRTGRVLARFEVSPPDECPRQPEGTTARDIGIEYAKAVTQADGHGSSSYCGDPLAVRDIASFNGLNIYELALTCVSETLPGPDDDEMDVEEDNATINAEPIITIEGKKWPTYLVDISQPWRKRVLAVDPAGNDPRLEHENRADMAIIRTILANLKSFAIQKPTGICIEDLPTFSPLSRGTIIR